MVIVLAVAAMAIVFFLGAGDKGMEQETSGFVTETVEAISHTWDPQELLTRAEPGLIKAMASQGQGVRDLFAVYSKLGALKASPSCRLKDTAQFKGTADHYVTASYICAAEYANGPGTLLLTVRRGEADSVWRVYYINISSPYFSELHYPRTK